MKSGQVSSIASDNRDSKKGDELAQSIIRAACLSRVGTFGYVADINTENNKLKYLPLFLNPYT